MTNKYTFDDDRPEVIAAKAEAKKKVLEARSKMHPTSQFILTLFDGLGDIIGRIGCLVVIILVILVIFAPNILTLIF